MAADVTNTETKTLNPADEYPSSRPGLKTAIGAAILLIGGLAIYYW
jgi:hypothetical protein